MRRTINHDTNFDTNAVRALLGMGLMTLLTVSASAQQKYLLRERDAAGDIRQNLESFTMALTMHSAAQKAPFKMTETEEQRYRTEILAVDAEGRATDVRRTYSVYVKRQDGTAGKNVKADSLQGKSARIRRVGGQVTVTSENGTLDEASRQELMGVLDSDIEYYSKRAVAVGEEWSPNSVSVAKAFKGAQNLSLRGRIVDIVPFGGHKCAHVKWKLSADVPAGEFTLKMKMQGDSYEALDIHHTLSMVFTGPMLMNGATKTNGKAVPMTAEGTADMKMAADWTKASGKPVTNSGPAPAH